MAYELDMEIEYLIAGPIEEFNEKRNIEQFNSERFKCTFLGVKDRDQLSALYQNAQALLVPSLTENFGLVVAEALGHGLPVIASTSTPWGSYPSCPALQCLPLEIDLWKQGTTELARPESRESMIEIAQRFYSKHLINDAILKQHLALFAS